MLALLLATGLLVGACVVLGQALAYLCGWREWVWWSPAVGLCVLLILFGQAVHVPGHQVALLVFSIVLAIGGAVLVFVKRSARPPLEMWALGLVALLIAAIPFFIAGNAGILGPTLSNDMSQHLTAAWWLRDRTGMLPTAAIGGNLISTGYPLGPHALVSNMARILDLGDVRAFSALSLAAPVLAALTAFELVKETTRRAARWAFSLAVGLGYLMVAYLAQGQFKETILALVVFAVAVVLNDLVRAYEHGRVRWPRTLPVAVLFAGAIYAYSYGAAIWIAATVAFFLGAEVFRRRELFALVRDWGPAAAITGIAAIVLVAPEIERIQAFRKSIFGQESLRNKGNLSHALNPLETLGVWFNGDFRFNPDPRWPTTVFCILALAALVIGLRWWWRRKSLALPAAIVAGVVVWAMLTQTVNIYNAAKGLIVLGPLVMACAGAPLAAAWGRPRGPWFARALGVILFAGVVVASGGILRSTPIGLGSHDAEFAKIRPLVRHHATLFVDNDHFGQWELRGAKPLYTTNSLYAPKMLGQHHWKQSKWLIDIDNYGRKELNKLDYIVISNGAYRSEIPPNFKLALQTPSYDLYKRGGPTPTRIPLESEGDHGTVFDCTSERGRDFQRRFKWAGVLPEPIVRSNWTGSIGRPGGKAELRTQLPPGRWDVSIQYVNTQPVTLRAPGLERKLAANFGLITSYWDAGTVTSDGKPFTLSAQAGERNWFGKLFGAPRALRAFGSPGNSPLFNVAFTRHGETPKRTPVSEACGKYVDWFAPAGSSMRGRSESQ